MPPRQIMTCIVRDGHFRWRGDTAVNAQRDKGPTAYCFSAGIATRRGVH
jgi:hypothetical protein